MTEKLLNIDGLVKVLQELGEDVRSGYVDTLVRNGHPTQENTLASTVRSLVEVNGTTYSVVLELQEYWQYVEDDTRPHWPPRDAILHWVHIKPVIPRPDENGNLPSPEQLAFLISRKISREGTTGTHDLQKAKDAIIPYYEERILAELDRTVLDYIAKIVESPTP